MCSFVSYSDKAVDTVSSSAFQETIPVSAVGKSQLSIPHLTQKTTKKGILLYSSKSATTHKHVQLLAQ